MSANLRMFFIYPTPEGKSWVRFLFPAKLFIFARLFGGILRVRRKMSVSGAKCRFPAQNVGSLGEMAGLLQDKTWFCRILSRKWLTFAQVRHQRLPGAGSDSEKLLIYIKVWYLIRHSAS